MKYTELAFQFSCAGDMLLGILAKPESPATTGVVVIVGGPQYRVGSHRQFVLLSRALATAGYAVLRFDYRGMGDSEGEQRDFQAVSEDIAAAINLLQEKIPTINKVVLWGLCDGASAALLYCHCKQDSRVSGLCLLNPWIRSQASLARTHVKYYYVQRLKEKEFWKKLLQKGIALKVFISALHNLREALTSTEQAPAVASTQPSFQQIMASGWKNFDGRIFLILSRNDYTAKEFLEFVRKDADWKIALKHPNLVSHHLQGADHTFSDSLSRIQVETLTLNQILQNPATGLDALRL